MPQASAGKNVTAAAQLNTGVVTNDAVLDDTLGTADIGPNGVGDSEIAAHTTTKIVVPIAKVQAGTQGGTLYFGAAGALSELPAGTSGQFLQTKGAAANPVWATAGGYVLSPSATLQHSADTERSKANAGYSKVKEIIVYHGGKIRAAFQMKQSGGDIVSADLRINGNSTAISTDTTTNTNYVAKTQDITIPAGASVELWISGGAGATGYVNNFRISYDAAAQTGTGAVTTD